MEQEETKTTAATGVEMPPEAESWVQLHESELTELMQKQAKAAITELKRQEKQERKKEKYHNTFTLMKCYRDAVFHIENAISDGQQLELKGMTDEQQRTYLESIRRTRFKTLIMTAHIDKAAEEIERRREAAGRGVEYKACKAGYTVYDYNGKAVYTAAGQQTSAGVPFSVQVDILDLNIRTGAGTNYAKTGETTGKGVFTIVEVKAGQGASAGWGRLKSGAGWISLDYATRLA